MIEVIGGLIVTFVALYSLYQAVMARDEAREARELAPIAMQAIAEGRAGLAYGREQIDGAREDLAKILDVDRATEDLELPASGCAPKVPRPADADGEATLVSEIDREQLSAMVRRGQAS